MCIRFIPESHKWLQLKSNEADKFLHVMAETNEEALSDERLSPLVPNSPIANAPFKELFASHSMAISTLLQCFIWYIYEAHFNHTEECFFTEASIPYTKFYLIVHSLHLLSIIETAVPLIDMNLKYSYRNVIAVCASKSY